MNDIPVPRFDEETEKRFRELVLQEGTLTITAIREQMAPALDKYDDIPLIQKMLHILAEGEE